MGKLKELFDGVIELMNEAPDDSETENYEEGYDEDFARWVDEQAELQLLDYEN
jgi:hypothetical protein